MGHIFCARSGYAIAAQSRRGHDVRSREQCLALLPSDAFCSGIF
jgi:hypothetical protein